VRSTGDGVDRSASSRQDSRAPEPGFALARNTHHHMSVKRFLVAIPVDDGGVELYPMKEWLRRHPDMVPDGLDATLSTSHQLRNALKATGWHVKSSDSEVRLMRPADGEWQKAITDVLGDDSDSDESDESADSVSADPAFGLEYQLRDFLSQNLPSIRVGDRSLRLYVDPAGRDGVEYPTAVGPIDLLAVDAQGNFTVFELKRARTADRAVGQLTRYMGWVKHTIGRGRTVDGVIVAKSINTRLRYAASVIPGVSLFEYHVVFHLQAAGAITNIDAVG
jgi:hypothetical protein